MASCRYYRIADITLQIESDLPMNEATFSAAINRFAVDQAGDDVVSIHHHFKLPDIGSLDLSREVYRKVPWAIYQTDSGWIYQGILPEEAGDHTNAAASRDHADIHIYSTFAEQFLTGDYGVVSIPPTDQILIAQLLAGRAACYLHSAGAIINGRGMLFVGHSEAGKSTIIQMLIDAGNRGDLEIEILCDDRNIVRRRDDGWRVYGSWSHGDISTVSPASAPLQAICFLEKAGVNSIARLTDRQEINHRLLAHLIKPFVTMDWWEKTLDTTSQLAAKAGCYLQHFDKSGDIVAQLKTMSEGKDRN